MPVLLRELEVCQFGVIVGSIVNSGATVERIFNHTKCIIPTRVNVVIDHLCIRTVTRNMVELRVSMRIRIKKGRQMTPSAPIATALKKMAFWIGSRKSRTLSANTMIIARIARSCSSKNSALPRHERG
jgi:hypothetical protein